MRRISALLALAVVLLAGCSSSKPAAVPAGGTPNAGKAMVTLRLGYFPNITHATAIVGVQAGIFAKNLGPNVKLETSTFNAGPAAVEALFSNALDASYMGPNPAVNAFVRSNGAAVRIISGATSGGASLVVRPDITTAADLRGKKLATPQLGGTQDVALRTWLQGQGLKTDAQGGGDVSITPQENADTLDAFKQNQIAGAWVPEPWATRLVLEGGGKVLVDERDLWPGGQFATTLLVVRMEFLQKHADVVENLLRGQVAANTFVNKQPGEAQTVVNNAIQQITGKPLKNEVISGSWSKLGFTNDPLASTVKKSANDAVALNFLMLNSADLTKIFDLRPLNAVLRSTGNQEVSGL